MFEEYLIKNLALYFDKYESELQTTVPEPEVAIDAEANLDMDDAAEIPAGEEETGAEEAPELELQELLKHLDVDDIIKNLL
jgi:hypothetical protein